MTADGPSLDHDARAIVDLVAAATAGYRADAARRAVEAMLAVGRSPSEVLEVLLHLVPFVGFARVLRAVAIAREVFSEQERDVEPVRSPAPADRYRRGRTLLREIAGSPAEAVLTTLEVDAPDLERVLVELTYGDVYSRAALGTPRRLLATITALVALGDTTVLLRAQAAAGLSWGWSLSQLEELVARAEPFVDPRVIAEARSVLAEMP